MRRLTAFGCVFALAAAALAVPALPASAHTDACAGWGQFQTGQAIGEPLLAPAVTTSFVANLAPGLCVGGGEFWVSGTISGWCSDAVGTGFTSSGHSFGFTIEGGVIAVTGGVVGTGYLQNPFSLTGCVNPNSLFIAYWAVALAHLP